MKLSAFKEWFKEKSTSNSLLKNNMSNFTHYLKNNMSNITHYYIK